MAEAFICKRGRPARPRWPGVVSGTINKHYIPYRDQPTHSPNRCQIPALVTQAGRLPGRPNSPLRTPHGPPRPVRRPECRPTPARRPRPASAHSGRLHRRQRAERAALSSRRTGRGRTPERRPINRVETRRRPAGCSPATRRAPPPPPARTGEALTAASRCRVARSLPSVRPPPLQIRPRPSVSRLGVVERGVCEARP